MSYILRLLFWKKDKIQMKSVKQFINNSLGGAIFDSILSSKIQLTFYLFENRGRKIVSLYI